MTRTLRLLASLVSLAAVSCTAVSGFDDLRQSGCATAVCDDTPELGDAGDVVPSDTPSAASTDSGAGASDSSSGDTGAVVDSAPRPDGAVADTAAGPSDTGVADAAKDAVAGDAAAAPCPTGKGAPMARVVTTNSLGATYTFCIDKSEATNAQYQLFLDAAPPLSLQPSICGSVNITFTPGSTWPLSPPMANKPVVNVDWCDAAAYCAWTGKRLCGRLGGGANPITEQANPTSGEWMNACTKGDATRRFPYGPTYDATRCNALSSGLVDVGSKTLCEGGPAGVFDMSGNAYEWENSCGELPADNCFIRGGSYQTTSEETLSCAGRATRARNAYSPNTGIRCCAD